MLKYILREFQQIWYGYGVPYVPISDTKLQILTDTIELEDGEVFIDIGCGDGRVLQAVSKKYPNSRCIGYESCPYPYKLALKRREVAGGVYELHNQDIFTVSLQKATSIYIYMVPYMLKKITKKIERECKKGTKIYIKSHQVKDWKLLEVVALSEKNNLYIYEI